MKEAREKRARLMRTTDPQTRKTNGILRIAFAAVILAVSLYIVQQRKPATRASAPKGPFPTAANFEQSFDWVPKYPNAQVAGIRNRQSREQMTYGYQFDTPDSADQVLSFYEGYLRTAGFKIDRKPPGEYGASLHAEDAAGKRILQLDAGRLQAGRTIVPDAGKSAAQNPDAQKKSGSEAKGKTEAAPASITGVNVVAIDKLGS